MESKIAYGLHNGVPLPIKVDSTGRLFISAGASTILLYDNYSDFPTTPSIDDLAYARNGEGVYLINRKPSGVYRFDGSNWIKGGDLASYFDDDNFVVYNATDNTKEMKFDVSSITTGNTRTVTMPDYNVDLDGKITTDVFVSTDGVDETTSGSRGNPYRTIGYAMSQISPNGLNRYAINVVAGVYSESPITMKSYSSIVGVSASQVVVTPTDINSTLFEMASNSSLIAFTVSGVTNGIAVANSTGTTTAFTNTLIIDNCDTGIYLSGATNMTCLSTQLTSTVNVGFDSNATFFNGFVCSSVLSNADITFKTSSQLQNQGLIRAFNIGIYGGTQAIFADGGIIDVHTLCQSSCPNCVKTDNGGYVSGFGFDMHYVTGNHIEQSNTSDVVRIWASSFDQDQLLLSNPSNIQLDFDDQKDGDEGMTLYKEFHVGSPELGHETCLGGGDSYTRGMAVYSFDGSSTYTDRTVDASSYEGSTFTFDNTGVDSAIYVASTLANGDQLKHFGIKALINTASTIGSGEIITEYYNGTSWTECHTMSTLSSTPYTRYAEEIFQRSGSEQVRYNTDILNDWTKNDPMSLGTNYFWIRFRIATTITTAPVFEQFKLHTNRTEINSDGFIEFFGDARPFGTLPWAITDNQASSNSPANQDFFLLNNPAGGSKDLAMGGIENSFLVGATDRTGKVWKIPNDMDTSSPILFKFYWSGEIDPLTGQSVDWDITAGLRSVGEKLWMTSATAETNTANIKGFTTQVVSGAIDTGEELDIKTSEVYIDLSDALPNDMIFISIGRVGGNDTYIGDTTLHMLDVSYLKWSLGGFNR